jgi:hypothetical protein
MAEDLILLSVLTITYNKRSFIMKAYFFFILIFSSLSSQAFTISSETALTARYAADEVSIDVSSDGCTGPVGLSATALLDDVEEAVERYWNKVPTSRVKFIRGNVLATASATLDLTAWITAAGAVDRIVVGCSNSATHFSGTTLGVASIATIGGALLGGVLLGDTAAVAALSRDERLAVLAHELGHAFGLGHSLDETALMFFSVSASKIQVNLTRDDHDGITWLYPHDKDLGGCLGSLGTIAFVNSGDDGKAPWNRMGSMSLGFIIMLILGGFIRLLGRGPKSRELNIIETYI